MTAACSLRQALTPVGAWPTLNRRLFYKSLTPCLSPTKTLCHIRRQLVRSSSESLISSAFRRLLPFQSVFQPRILQLPPVLIDVRSGQEQCWSANEVEIRARRRPADQLTRPLSSLTSWETTGPDRRCSNAANNTLRGHTRVSGQQSQCTF